MTENLQDLLDLFVAAEYRRQLVLTGEQVQIRREVLQEGRQLEALLQPLLSELHVAHAGGQARNQDLRLDAVSSQDGD